MALTGPVSLTTGGTERVVFTLSQVKLGLGCYREAELRLCALGQDVGRWSVVSRNPALSDRRSAPLEGPSWTGGKRRLGEGLA